MRLLRGLVEFGAGERWLSGGLAPVDRGVVDASRGSGEVGVVGHAAGARRAGAPAQGTDDGQALRPGTVRDRLARLLDVEGCDWEARFTPHALRRACATHQYERGMDLIAVQQLLHRFPA
ncbi:tyrosine-type recombinase/integrase [Streptomyces sp. NPDC002596]|uniref:tyrosine-type recombinase/integrase n=1 Tax=Streptomyces sp. NPDC059460 TaxID=3346840 RepID=UPI0036A8811E